MSDYLAPQLSVSQLKAHCAAQVLGIPDSWRIALNEAELPKPVLDSRDARPGDLFFALPGTRVDGHQFVPELQKRGVYCVVSRDHEFAEHEGLLCVEDPRRVLDWLAAELAGLAQHELRVIGITGTNGKTSTCWILQQLLGGIDPSCGLCGTIMQRVGLGTGTVASLTTPDTLTLARLAQDVIRAGGRHLVMEVSSHAIDQQRAGFFEYAAVAFLNLSPEHLDYHGNMEDYFAVKAGWIALPGHGSRIVCVDSRWGSTLADHLQEPCVTYGEAAGQWRVLPKSEGLEQRFVLQHEDGDTIEMILPLPGRHNLQNATAAVLLALELGLSAEDVKRRLSTILPVPGRMERVSPPAGEKRALVLIDYAHSPDGYERLFQALAGIKRTRTNIVFGCGGDRDRSKRAVMTCIALANADQAWITLDNPRSEDPGQIFDDMLKALTEEQLRRVTRIEDRQAAIQHVLAQAGSDDLVLLVGKGHERYQILGSEKSYFNETEIVRACWEQK